MLVSWCMKIDLRDRGSVLLLSGCAYALNFTPLKELTKKDWSNPTNDMHLSMQLKETIIHL
jgi:hypothetical protein